MERYNYREAICEDIREYIEENEIRVTNLNRQKLEEELSDKLWLEDSVTGNASGSYTFNTWKSEEYLLHNFDLLVEAIEEFGGSDYKRCLQLPEVADVTIRCYLLGECLSEVLDELEEEELEEEEDEE